jgi:hypothetical protein
VGARVLSQTLPYERREELATPNLQSTRGVPISRVVGTPPGSDGRVSFSNESTGIYVNPTTGQFRSLSLLGGTVGLRRSAWQTLRNSAILNAGTTNVTAAVAEQMGVPVGKDGSGAVVVVSRRVQVGTPMFARRSTLSFGALIEAPLVAENGIKLPDGELASYWLPEPYTVTSHQGSGYYWSRHSRKAYAIQAGPISVTWVKAQPYALGSVPSYANAAGTTSFMTNGANVFLLYTQRYVVSAVPVKPTRRMYWTQKAFQPTGKPILVPKARVGAINVVYNDQFPRTVASEFKTIGASEPTDGSTNAPLQELRTLWYEQQLGTIYAYNAEGRVFVEMLGDSRGDGTHVPLGFEIVDVSQQPVPRDVQVELGDRVVPPDAESPEDMDPEPLAQPGGLPFAFMYNTGSGKRTAYYATRETQNLNDYLVYWMESGVAGIRWPRHFARYQLSWPTDIQRFSLYVRPDVASEREAQATAVTLDLQNAPVIEYQDVLDRPRALFTSDFKFYSYLDATQPAHRTLIRYSAGELVGFERVFSWHVPNLRTTNFVGNAVVTNLTAWNGKALNWADAMRAPRVVNEAAVVGQRIQPPAGELGSNEGDAYVAGFVNLKEGDSLDMDSYKDPFAVGFDEAAKGAVIPVNAIPGRNRLEVWWFRRATERAGLNTGNQERGFSATHWPSAVGRYTVEWPTAPREIVLASKLGGNDARVEEAGGKIYVQNDPNRPGYNPNEEHAVMSAGVPYATRDDLNIVSNLSNEYSSQPFVLVSYQAFDGRPAVATYKVLREKPEMGWVFDYVVPAGRLLQPPPPLTFLQKPTTGTGDAKVSRNYEPAQPEQDLPGGWQASDQDGFFGHYQRFTFQDRHQDLWVYRGPHAGLPVLKAGTFRPETGDIAPLASATVVVGKAFRVGIHASRQDEFLSLEVTGGPAWVAASGLGMAGTPPSGSSGTYPVTYVVRDLYDGTSVTNQIALQVLASGQASVQGALQVTSTNRYTGSTVTFKDRAPFLALSPSGTNSFTMRYYYKTEASFAWPGISDPPATGSIVPYLRPLDPATGRYVGDPASPATDSLDIVYRPFWPERDPADASKPVATLPFAATLTTPKLGLPGVKDFKTAHVLYQQSIGGDVRAARSSVVLHDATRAKFADIAEFFTGVDPVPSEVPAGVYRTLYQAKYYFPNLPPHLGNRLCIDPNRGTKGALVLVGEYKQEALGESYLMLNVLRGSDLAAVKALCPEGDVQGRAVWNMLVDALATDVETFVENPEVPGTYIPDADQTVRVGVGELAEVRNANTPVDSYTISATGPGSGYVTVLEASGTDRTREGDPVAMHIFRVGGGLTRGEVKVIPSANPLSEYVTFQYTGDMAGRHGEFEYEWKIAAPVDGFPPMPDATMSRYIALSAVGTNQPLQLIGGAGIQALGDNYVVMRYRPVSPTHPLYKANPGNKDWSEWTEPALAEGWIKRVLAGINPFNQRVTDLFNNKVNTDVSILTQAGRRWEGDVALNLDTINNYGLIEIYETVLRRGRMLSIESGYNYGPANDALLLAAGYLSDLYMMVGNEAWADAANPTIGIGTADKTYGDVATALFAFKGQVPTLLEEELGLLRGRDDFLMPGVEVSPVYNRMVWNYTRGIDAGEVIYALNYNIKEKADGTPDGVINAEDAAWMFPQGHGDAYGHYLTALKGYYSLLMNDHFDWVPRIEAVNVLGKPVSVDYQDERKFAKAATAWVRAAQQVFELTWRKDFASVKQSGWGHLSESRENPRRTYTDSATGSTRTSVRRWGADHWATRAGQGNYLNWLAGNAILPAVDPDPTHEGIQKVDRTTVPELREMAETARALETAMDNCEGGLSVLGISESGMAMDLNPNAVVGQEGGTHFEQVYERAVRALGNAVGAFNEAKDVTQLMRSEQDSLTEMQAQIARQELAYQNRLIELYGTPYPDDVGPGKLYKQGYAGPDLVHFSFVDLSEIQFPTVWNYEYKTAFDIELRDVPADWGTKLYRDMNFDVIVPSDTNPLLLSGNPRNGVILKMNSVTGKVGYHLVLDIGPHGFALKPQAWQSRRGSPGRIQQAISEQISAHERLRQEVYLLGSDIGSIDKNLAVFKAANDNYKIVRGLKLGLFIGDQILEKAKFANDIFQVVQDAATEVVTGTTEGITEALPKSFIAGLAAGGDVTSAGRAALKALGVTTKSVTDGIKIARETVVKSLELANSTYKASTEFFGIEQFERETALYEAVNGLIGAIESNQLRYSAINLRLREYDDTRRALRSLLAEGDRVQAEREVFRRQTASVVQGYRTRDAAFRVFRNEKLERYKTMFDLASRYALLAANAYDYETGLLGTSAGRDFVRGITASRALGVIRDGRPQFAGSSTGDPGISSSLAEMKSDWDVLRGRLGFNNPDAYGTTASLRMGKFRIEPGANGDAAWKDVLNKAYRADLLADGDIRRHCMQVDRGDGLPVPGLVIQFQTTIEDGLNLFGQPYGAGDKRFSPSSFATKIFGMGVALEGYRGMDSPVSNGAGGTTPSDPDGWFLDPLALGGSPYVYLVPVGVDFMRSPPLGDASGIRSWAVEDLAIPMPFNIGASEYATKKLYQSANSLSEPMFEIRKHQAFRPVPTAAVFSPNLYTAHGTLQRSQYTNNRLVGRSVWNSQWKLVIPGHTLLSNPQEGLDRFLQTVKDIKLHFVTYSYSGN